MAKSIRELPLMEQLAIKQAVYSKLGEEVSTKNPDSLRARMDEAYVSSYIASVATGVSSKSNNVFVNGQDVGTYSVRTSRAMPQETSKRLVVKDPYAFDAYVREQAADEAFEYVHMVMDNFASFMLESYGVICDGCEVVEETIPAQPSKVIGTTLRIDADKVANAINGYLPTTIAGLLGGGADA